MNNTRNERIIWIDYFKVFACLMVLIGHYYNAFYSFCNLIPDLSKYVVVFFERFPTPYLDGNFWVCVFCILSGYLSSSKKISSLKQLIKECIMRYLRFVLPLLFINVIIYLINLIFGFRSIELSSMYNNNWLGTFFTDITLSGAIKNSITLGSKLNGPLWMIRPLFVGNIMILCVNYIKNKLNNHEIVRNILLLAILLGMFFVSLHYEILLYMFVTLLGMIIFNITKQSKPKYNLLIFLLILAIIHIVNILPITLTLTKVDNMHFLNVISAFAFIISIFFCTTMRKFKKSKSNLGSISFYVYLIHWPLICSLSSSLITLFTNYTMGFLIVLLLTLVIVIILSYLCSKTIDKFFNKINLNIDKKICELLKLN